MKIIGIDTTTPFLCIGAYDNGAIYEYTLKTGTQLSALVTISIERVLKALRWKMKDVDYFFCGIGPGSFTGIRVGVATIKGLSWASGKPVVEIPSLDALAMNTLESQMPVIPMIDAKRNLLYSSVYRYKKGVLVRTAPYRLSSLEDIAKEIKNEVIVLGDAVGIYREEIVRSIKGVVLLDKDHWRLKTVNLIAHALAQIQKKKIKDSFTIKPLYLYQKECQIKQSNR
ncbi:MAG: tRNA (adenosine(37)-N6)-threonylcarbamoyltransferase complex dimerization subunit type 1 TsaB [Candidatus Omnitrophica bacterium]|nr:tRNA (adenosine(37)-N6)-threonylcarbamoyltransferase complex dimerization subunit type 1 TsaB [Candidatus Omnitrophota bacterium]